MTFLYRSASARSSRDCLLRVNASRRPPIAPSKLDAITRTSVGGLRRCAPDLATPLVNGLAVEFRRGKNRFGHFDMRVEQQVDFTDRLLGIGRHSVARSHKAVRQPHMKIEQ